MRWTHALLLLAAAACDDTVYPPASGGSGSFSSDWYGVGGMLYAECRSCHGPESGLAVLPDAIEEDVRSGDEAYVVPGSPEDSLLWQVLVGAELPSQPEVMPPGGALPEEGVAHVEEWIADGAAL